MEKRVYLKDLSVEKIIERLDEGERLYVEECINAYYKKINNIIVQFVNNTPYVIGASFEVGESALSKYFIDEVEEPEADESCIDKLCWFWNTEGEQKSLGILYTLKVNLENKEYPTYVDTQMIGFEHCRALTKEEALALVKE